MVSFRRFGARSGADPSADCSAQPETLGAEISELSDLLRKKRAAERAQQKASVSESVPDYETFSGSFSANPNVLADMETAGGSSNTQDASLGQILQMNMMMQNMQRSMMIQKQMFEEETKRRETDELRMEIKKIELLILQRGLSESQPPQMQIQSCHQNPGSVRARVGSKRPLPPVNDPHPVVSSRTPQNPKSSEDNRKQEKERKVKKYTNQKLPRDLILTRFTKDGPKPANNNPGSEESKKESFNWKRQKKSDQEEDEDQVVDETSDEDED